eukprot:TRINITY_DN12422_c0_g1_i1.p1 TRINITY_DN12422_c0_g1~~TRINITY_DN12422_c0_g1_i1.p1  ORF type:complete len:203 (-),score=39.71 TRINITY_DN12422_c0_g1_i1:104-673(-)
MNENNSQIYCWECGDWNRSEILDGEYVCSVCHSSFVSFSNSDVEISSSSEFEHEEIEEQEIEPEPQNDNDNVARDLFGNVVERMNPIQHVGRLGPFIFSTGNFTTILQTLSNQERNNAVSDAFLNSLERFNCTLDLIGENCPICFGEYKEESELISLPCQHTFHSECLIEWLKQNNTCPICRANVEENE